MHLSNGDLEKEVSGWLRRLRHTSSTKLGFEGIVSLNPQLTKKIRYLAKIFPDGREYSSFGPDENIEEMQAILFLF
jgi:hypothetical protein